MNGGVVSLSAGLCAGLRPVGDGYRTGPCQIRRMAEPSPAPSVRERIEDAMREIGTLVVAFAPLEAAFARESDDRLATTLILLTYGIVLFVGALLFERRRTRVQ